MKVQLLSDLHLETESFEPAPAPGAELLLLAGDIDSTWAGYKRFRDWPVPVFVVAGNHEFDGRDVTQAAAQLRTHCAAVGLVLLDKQSRVMADAQGRRIRFTATPRWSDFDVLGEAQRERCQRAGRYFLQRMAATHHGLPFDAAAVRTEALACRAWLAEELTRPAQGAWDATVVMTHFAPSLRSADPRYGHQPGTASFCNADDALLPLADVWVHGHLHCRHDYRVDHPGGGTTRVLCNARGHVHKGEADGYDGLRVFEV